MVKPTQNQFSQLHARVNDFFDDTDSARCPLTDAISGVATAQRWRLPTYANIPSHVASTDETFGMEGQSRPYHDTALAGHWGYWTCPPPHTHTLSHSQDAHGDAHKDHQDHHHHRKRARPSSLLQSTTSTELSPILDEDTATEEETTDVHDIFSDGCTNETVNTPLHISTDAVYIYGCKRGGDVGGEVTLPRPGSLMV